MSSCSGKPKSGLKSRTRVKIIKTMKKKNRRKGQMRRSEGKSSFKIRPRRKTG